MRLSTRLTLAMIVLVLLTATAVGLLINRSIEERALPRALDRIDVHATLLASALDASVRGARSDVNTQGQGVSGLVRAIVAGGVHPIDGTPAEQWRNRLAARFVADLTAKPSYAQFRLIGLADGGREIVRVDRMGPGRAIRVVPDAGLTRKGERSYFKAGIALKPGEVYGSPISFNQEGGVFETPYVPTLRLASAVFAPDGSPFGIMIINVDMRLAFSEIRSAGRDGAIYVVNEQGDFLVHPNPYREFGFEFGRPYRVADEFPEFTGLFERDDTTPRIVADHAGERFGLGWDVVRLAGGPRVAVLESVPYARILATDTTVPSLLGAVVIALCAIPLVVLLARSLTRPLAQMTGAVERFARDGTMPVPSKARGEIGLLAGAFSRMATEVREKTTALQREVEEHRRTGDRERLFSAAVESSEDAIITYTLDGTITGWNPGAERLFGFTAQEAVRRTFEMFVPPAHAEEPRMLLAKVGQGEVVSHYETVRRHKDGHDIDVAITVSPFRSPSGVVVGAAAIVRDITESKRAAEALLDSARMARGIIDTALDAFVQMDEAGIIINWNPQAEAIFGWSREEAFGQPLADLIVPERHRARHKAGFAHFLRTGKSTILGRRIEIEGVRRDGREIKVELSVTALRQRGGTVFNGFMRDLTSTLAAQEQLRQSQKMEAVGQLTGGIAHDFNNMLTVITGTIEILAEEVADRPQIAAIAKLISEAADRGAELTRQLLAFARKQPLQPRDTDINALLVETTKLLRPALGEHVEIELSIKEDASPALVDPTQLTTALLNLAVNARDAMPGGGKLTLETKNVVLDEAYAGAHSEVQPGSYVMIAVSDTGVGIPEAIREKVFEPFFSTKEVGRGTGLGLSMVYGFVKQSGGHIKVYSEEGHGTTFRIYLPQARTLPEQAAGAVAISPVESGNETILVVEDNAMVRNSVTAQLASLGYRTIAAANGAEALAIVDGGYAFDLLFTDVIMSGPLNGRQLADETVKRRPGVKVLFTSGYTENAIIHHGRLDPGVLLLAKPYRKAELARMVRLALGAEPRGQESEPVRRAMAQ